MLEPNPRGETDAIRLTPHRIRFAVPSLVEYQRPTPVDERSGKGRLMLSRHRACCFAVLTLATALHGCDSDAPEYAETDTDYVSLLYPDAQYTHRSKYDIVVEETFELPTSGGSLYKFTRPPMIAPGDSGTLYVADSHSGQVYSHSSADSSLRSFDSNPSGSRGEIGGMWWFSGPGELWVWYPLSGRFRILGEQGSLLREFVCSGCVNGPIQMVNVSGGRFVGLRTIGGEKNTTLIIMLFSPGLEFVSEVLRVPYQELWRSSDSGRTPYPMKFQATPSVAAIGEGVFAIGIPRDREIRIYDLRAQLVRKIAYEGRSVPTPAYEKADFEESVRNRVSKKYAVNATLPLELPAFRMLVSSNDNSVWVQRTVSSGNDPQEGGAVYDILDFNGEWIGVQESQFAIDAIRDKHAFSVYRKADSSYVVIRARLISRHDRR